MNDLYTKTIEVDGVVYNYDPDQDIYYRRYQDESGYSQWAWVWCIIVLAAVCYYVEYLR